VCNHLRRCTAITKGILSITMASREHVAITEPFASRLTVLLHHEVALCWTRWASLPKYYIYVRIIQVHRAEPSMQN
jgi:hypothetical protein